MFGGNVIIQQTDSVVRIKGKRDPAYWNQLDPKLNYLQSCDISHQHEMQAHRLHLIVSCESAHRIHKQALQLWAILKHGSRWQPWKLRQRSAIENKNESDPQIQHRTENSKRWIKVFHKFRMKYWILTPD